MRLLLAQQHQTVQETEFLANADGWKTDYARDGFETLTYLLTQRYDLVLLDVDLPVLSGIKLLQCWRQVDERTRFVLMGRSPTFDQARQGILLGAADFLPLPLDAGALENLFRMKSQETGTLEDLYATLISPQPALLSAVEGLLEGLQGQSGYGDFACRLHGLLVEQIFEQFPWLNHFIPLESMTDSAAGPEEYLRRLRGLWMNMLELHPYTENELLHEVFDYILEHIDHALKQKDVAAHFFLSPSALSLLFSEHTKFTYNSYITNLRLLRTEYFLLYTDMKIQDIAERIGYQDYSYFSRQFKEKHYMTPAAFRQKFQGTIS